MKINYGSGTMRGFGIQWERLAGRRDPGHRWVITLRIWRTVWRWVR